MKGWKIIAPSNIKEQEITEKETGGFSKVKITKALITLADVLSYKGEIESNKIVLA